VPSRRPLARPECQRCQHFSESAQFTGRPLAKVVGIIEVMRGAAGSPPVGHPLRMHVLRCLAAGLLLAAGVIGPGIVIDDRSAYAAENTSLVVSPGAGSPGAQFTATYRWPTVKAHGQPPACTPSQITFEWDGSTLGQAATARTGSGCVAALHAAPPSGAYRGTSTHTITVANDASARAAYQVIERQASQPSSEPPSATSPGTTEAADPPATAVPGEPSDTASSAALAGSPKSGNAGTTVGLIGVGTVLFLGGAATLGFIAWQRRRPPLVARLASPRAAADTRPLPLRHRGVHRRSY
jgi:hypothetical protein